MCSKKKGYLLLIIIGILIISLGLAACAEPSTTETSLSFATTTQSIITTLAQTIPTTIAVTSLPISTTSKPPLFTAELTVVPSSGENAVLFFNNTNGFEKFSCNVELHATDGSFISTTQVISDFVPPKTHLITRLPPSFFPPKGMSPSDVTNGLTITSLQIYNVTNYPQFASMTLKNLVLSPVNTSNNTYTLTGRLYNNGQQFSPMYTRIQILKRSTDSNLILVGEDAYGITVPPTGEFVDFSIQLSDSITIIDSANGIIDGEIPIVIQSSVP
jgi:hypothetical protein